MPPAATMTTNGKMMVHNTPRESRHNGRSDRDGGGAWNGVAGGDLVSVMGDWAVCGEHMRL